MAVVQVVDADGNAKEGVTWFADDADSGAEAYCVIGVLGAQGSGKSTLLNALFGTSFAVRSGRGALGSATTKGVAAAKSTTSSSLTVVLDVEGADARERGSDGKAFASRCAAFASSLCDAILVNMWFRDLARADDSAGFALLDAVFAQTAKVLQNGSASKSLLTFVVRDAEDCSDESLARITSQVQDQCNARWSRLSQDVTLEHLFDVNVALLPHPRHQKNEYESSCKDLAATLEKSIVADMSKGIPANEIGTYAKQEWESVSPTQAAAVVTRSNPNEAAALRADRVFSQSLSILTREAAEMDSQLDGGAMIEKFGDRATALLSGAVDTIQAELSDCQSDPLVEQKMQQLISAYDTVLHGLFVKQLHILRENSLSHFKSQITSTDIMPDFAFFSADQKFTRGAQESVRTGSSWSFENEQADLQTLMTELVAERKRLVAFRSDAVQANQTAMQVLRMQQAQMNAIQQQAMGGVSGQWNTQAMYRPPDTNFKVTLGYEPGLTSMSLGMVPEESSALFGGSGFTAGLGPMNLGVNLKVNI
mmetsp:Transcript_4760/g.10174  ORF Transcript_4760/g.10174 Transcript_4760/m.10174 type:complete len:537 (-) Transcript_4760:873-2483(-)